MPIHSNDHIAPLERHEAPETKVVKDGITKREYLAALAMQGLIAHYGYGEAPAADVQEIATWSVKLADALIEQLTD